MPRTRSSIEIGHLVGVAGYLRGIEKHGMAETVEAAIAYLRPFSSGDGMLRASVIRRRTKKRS